MMPLEELQEEVVGELHTLTKDSLLEVCDFLNISGSQREDVKGKSRISLLTHIMKCLEGEEVASLEDEGMSRWLLLKDKLTCVLSGMENGTQQTEPASETKVPGGTNKRQEVGLDQVTSVNATADNDVHQPHSTVSQQVSQPLPPSAQSHAGSYWRKDFKISGQIGEPGQRDKLTFSSLAHQIENGLSRGYPEIEITDAVIRAISPGSQLRSYLEGKAHLSLPTLRRILRSHFQEKSATELYKQLASEAQHSKETPQSFLMRVLDLRQKVLFASQESESGLKYDPALVQRMCLHTILTGLQNDSIRIDMQPLLVDTKTADELLLEKLNIACANETERRNKKRFSAPHPVTSASVVQSEEKPPAKSHVQEAKVKVPPELLTELAELKTGVASLQGLSAEIAQIKETLQQPMFQPQPTVPPQQLYYHNYSQPQAPATMQPQYAPHLRPNRPAYTPRKCFGCQQAGTDERCMHCYRCGSGEHFQAGCRTRPMRPSREAPLNGKWLPLRDEC